MRRLCTWPQNLQQQLLLKVARRWCLCACTTPAVVVPTKHLYKSWKNLNAAVCGILLCACSYPVLGIAVVPSGHRQLPSTAGAAGLPCCWKTFLSDAWVLGNTPCTCALFSQAPLQVSFREVLLYCVLLRLSAVLLGFYAALTTASCSCSPTLGPSGLGLG